MNGDLITAIHAMVYLYHRGDRHTSEEIAENACTNPVCVRRVMAKIVRAGLAERRLGKENGGYCCVGDPTLAELARALETKLVETRYRSGDPDKPCMIASGMGEYADGLCRTLDALCAAHLATVRVSDVESALRRRSESKKGIGEGFGSVSVVLEGANE